MQIFLAVAYYIHDKKINWQTLVALPNHFLDIHGTLANIMRPYFAARSHKVTWCVIVPQDFIILSWEIYQIKAWSTSSQLRH